MLVLSLQRLQTLARCLHTLHKVRDPPTKFASLKIPLVQRSSPGKLKAKALAPVATAKQVQALTLGKAYSTTPGTVTAKRLRQNISTQLSSALRTCRRRTAKHSGVSENGRRYAPALTDLTRLDMDHPIFVSHLLRSPYLRPSLVSSSSSRIDIATLAMLHQPATKCCITVFAW